MTHSSYKQMLDAVGVSSCDELFESIPKELKLPSPFTEDGFSEYEGLKHMEALAAKNSYASFDNYLGAGAYEHHVPAIVDAICSKSEFLTSYTPYQPEASQGMLQAIFEFQQSICELTSLDFANASLYDGASACAEALLMGLRINKPRTEVVIAGNLHPHYRAVIEQYLCHPEFSIVTAPILKNGQLDGENFPVSEKTAAVLLAYPNFFGGIDFIAEFVTLAKEKGALTILSANPLIYALYASAGELGIDIAVGDCQPQGMPLQFGGPYCGYLACRKEFVRQLPGRLVGETVDSVGQRGFVLTLQTREQHIRREKATSNICTNQALTALAFLVTVVWYGKEGLPKLALTNFQRAAYLRAGLHCDSSVPIFNEFVVDFGLPEDRVTRHFRQHQIEPGVHLGRYFPDRSGQFLVAVTETKSLSQLDKYIEVAKKIL